MLTYVSNENFINNKYEVFFNPVNLTGEIDNDNNVYFKSKYPKMFREYQLMCKNDKLKVKKIYVYNKYKILIFNSVIRKDPNQKVRASDFDSILYSIKKMHVYLNYDHIYFPNLNLINNLDFDYKSLIYKYFWSESISAYLYTNRKG